MNRPTGVSVLAILLFIGTGLCLLLAIGFFLGGAFVGSIIGTGAHRAGAGAAGAGLGALIGGAIGVFFIVFAVIDAICGYGLWNLKEWGRILTIICAGISFVFAALGILISMAHFHILGLFSRGIRAAIAALVIWYLTQPQIKAAFAPRVYVAQ